MAKYFIEPFANAGDKATVPEEAQLDGSVSFETGYGVDYQLDPASPPGLNIERTKFNQLMFEVTQALQQYQQFGFPDFITSADNDGAPFSYSANATVRYSGVNYYSLVDNNEDTPPSAKWGLVLYTQPVAPGSIEMWGFSTVKSGYVWMNGTTIGSATSGATGRANADTATIFAMLWADYSNTVLPIQTSAGAPSTRGISAAADFSANKRLPLPDYRGRSFFGLDNMGGASAANRITNAESGIGGTTLGASGGAQSVALTGNQNGGHTHSGTTDVSGTHTHAGTTNTTGAHHHVTSINTYRTTGTGGVNIQALCVDAINPPVNLNTSTEGNHSHTLSNDTAGEHTHAFTTNSSGLGSTHQNMPPAMIGGGFIMKL